MNPRRKQVADQCRAVAHLAKALAEVNDDFARMMAAEECPGMDALVESVGNRTSRHVELLGNILNGMDAVEEGDDWLDPIFKAAHEMFPQPLAQIGRERPVNALHVCSTSERAE